MNKPQMDDQEKTSDRTGYIHIAFSVGSREEVDRLTAQLNFMIANNLQGEKYTIPVVGFCRIYVWKTSRNNLLYSTFRVIYTVPQEEPTDKRRMTRIVSRM